MNSRGQNLRASGFCDPFVLLVIGVVMLAVGVFAAYTPAAPAPQPVPVPGANIVFAPYVFVDQTTGCQYLSTHTSTGLAPRIAADGKTHLGCKGGSQ